MGNKPGGQAGGGKGVDAAALEQARAIQEQDAAWLSAEKSRLKRMPAMHQNGMYHVPPGKPLIATLPGSNAQVLYESVHDSGVSATAVTLAAPRCRSAPSLAA